MEQAVQDFVQGKNIAVVGVSRQGKKFGNLACAELKKRDYQVFVVHPTAREIDGMPCYPSLTALRGRVDGVLVSVPASQAESVLREAAAMGVRNVWLQQGAESPDVLTLGRTLNLNLVHNKCVLMYAPPVRSFHGWHRGFMRLVGRL